MEDPLEHTRRVEVSGSAPSGAHVGADRPGGLSAERQRELVAAFAELVATVPDPQCGPAMASWVRAHGSVTASLAGLGLGVLAAFDSSMVWAADGARSPASWLVSNTGGGRISLAGSLKTARLARNMDHVTAAALAGDLCAEKVRLLTRARTDAVAELFDAEEEILAKEAARLTVDHLRVHLSGWRLRALELLERNEPDKAKPMPESEADCINLFEGFAGRGLIDGDLTPEGRELLFRAVGSEIDSWHRDGDLVDDDRSQGERNAAAILELIRRGAANTTEHGRPRPLVIALADWDSLTEAERQAILDLARAHEPGPADPDAAPGAEPEPGAKAEPRRASDSECEPASDSEPHCAPGPSDTEFDHHFEPSAADAEPEPRPVPAADARPSGRPERADPVPSGSPSSGAGSLATQRRCEIVGAGPIPVATLARLLADPETEICRVVLGPDGRPIDVGRVIRAGLAGNRPRAAGRPPPAPPASAPGRASAGPARTGPSPPPTSELLARLRAAPSMPLDLGRQRRHAAWAQWIALLVRSGGQCEVPGCTVAYWRTHTHHLQEWDQGGPTDVANLALACRFDHHHTIHRRGFSLEPTTDRDPPAAPIGPDAFELRRPDGTTVEVPYR